jgi:ABC-type ATPase with predicted acetyltransferase domain
MGVIYLKKGDKLEFYPNIDKFSKIYKVLKGNKLQKVQVFPPYKATETIHISPHILHITIRERINTKDWEKVKILETFHYRGMGLNKIVGRRIVLIAELEGVGIIGYGVLSSSVAAVSPRFKLFKTNFKNQMRDGLINKIARIPRIVVHPEFRGMHLGVIIAKHLVKYCKSHWDVNNNKAIIVEVIAAMTDYHKFFEKAGFIHYGYTRGYKGKAIIPQYGNGSFQKRDFSKYKFLQNQDKKPYLVYPLSKKISNHLKLNSKPISLSIIPKKIYKNNKIYFKKFSVKYKIANGNTERTDKVKEIFGVDTVHAFSLIIKDLNLIIYPGDVVLITGASGSGKSTLLKYFLNAYSELKKNMIWNGKTSKINLDKVDSLKKEFNCKLPLIDQVKKNSDFGKSIELLNSVGLTEAYLYIKKPNQLSEGQKYRFAIAKLCDSEKPIWVADEFGSTLSPEISAVVSKGLRKISYLSGATLILAAPHINNFVDSLLPNKLIKLKWGGIANIYSIMIKNVQLFNNQVSFVLFNNGNFTLNYIEIGFITLTGNFECYKKVREIPPSVKKTISFKYKTSQYVSIFIKTKEQVGEVIYLNY